MMLRYSFLLCLLTLAACSRPTVPPPPSPQVEAGVSEGLMLHRQKTISDIHYQLALDIPDQIKAPIQAQMQLTFTVKTVPQDVQLDFQEKTEQLKSLTVNGQTVAIDHRRDHIILPKRFLKAGRNQVDLAFQMGESALNRNPDFLYTLFVPDRARTAFPLFDQPNLKATYDLSLTIPAHWTAMAGGSEKSNIVTGDRRTITFNTSDKVSSYLFSFVAGDFQRLDQTINGRKMTMLHRETDPEKLAQNKDEIFTLHAAALDWLEDYTGIPYPFQKFGFVVLPGFPFGGMEHPGAIQYRSSHLFLPKNSAPTSQLSRARLISHEVAHMWFGDLVTMNWFDDVWTKEVFANFMAAKIINPSFPDINHRLNFYLSHYPAAYAVDRTVGANPIRQPLPNLNEAGSLYGSIIYQKAPIMMQQLELTLGAEKFQQGLRTYLKRYAGGNATWPQLIDIFDQLTDQDMKKWSDVWVNTPGRPIFDLSSDMSCFYTVLDQIDPKGTARVWPQQFQINETTVTVSSRSTPLQPPVPYDAMIPSDGMGYGLFPATLEQIYGIGGRSWSTLTDLEKGALLINLYEQMLENSLDPQELLLAFLSILDHEKNPLLLSRARSQINVIYWQFLSPAQRQDIAKKLETYYTDKIQSLKGSDQRAYYQHFLSIALTPSALEKLDALFTRTLTIEGLTLSINDRVTLATTLALKQPEKASFYLDQVRSEITNKDQLRRFDFIRPTLSPNQTVRDAWFASIQKLENRHTENWVLSGIKLLHHPLRKKQAEKYIQPSLALMREIQQTGSIFFPQQFISATLDSHDSDQIAQKVRRFLKERPDYNYQLSLKILQAADILYRKVGIKKKDPSYYQSMIR